jgi:hypothetical protein
MPTIMLCVGRPLLSTSHKFPLLTTLTESAKYSNPGRALITIVVVDVVVVVGVSINELVLDSSFDLLQAASNAVPIPIPPNRSADRRVSIEDGK